MTLESEHQRTLLRDVCDRVMYGGRAEKCKTIALPYTRHRLQIVREKEQKRNETVKLLLYRHILTSSITRRIDSTTTATTSVLISAYTSIISVTC